MIENEWNITSWRDPYIDGMTKEIIGSSYEGAGKRYPGSLHSLSASAHNIPNLWAVRKPWLMTRPLGRLRYCSRRTHPRRKASLFCPSPLQNKPCRVYHEECMEPPGTERSGCVLALTNKKDTNVGNAHRNFFTNCLDMIMDEVEGTCHGLFSLVARNAHMSVSSSFSSLIIKQFPINSTSCGSNTTSIRIYQLCIFKLSALFVKEKKLPLNIDT